MTLHQTKEGNITFDANTPAVIATFTGFMKSEQFQEFMKVGLKHLVDKLRSHENVLWLADTSAHKIQPKSDTEWVATVWTPQAMKAGLTHIAFVMPQDVFAQMSVQNYADKAESQKGIIIRMFGDIDNAKQWYQDARMKKAGLFS